MKPLYLVTLGLTALLAGCGEKAATKATAPANAAESMGNMAMPTDTAVKTVIDKTAGEITLDHGPIPEVGWPAMKMAFKASPKLLNSVAVGDRVAFDLTLRGNAGEVTAIRKQP
jgi:Cu/Ag efflux protein CusF